MDNKNIGFISFRFSGTDGVSLETKKWAEVLTKMGFSCFYLAGELDTPEESSFPVPEAHFSHPEIRELYNLSFSKASRPPALTAGIHKYREFIKKKIYEFIKMYDLDLLIPENSLTIPLNIPLGLAITEVIAETGIKAIAHHHDFFWERKRFLRNCVWDYLNSCFPPHLPSIKHVVINSSGQNQLALRTGISSTLIPNVMDFENPPPGPDDYNRDVREALGLKPGQLLFLQPTRVVQRKGIEHAIELTARIGLDAVLVISHASGDEGYEYQNRIREYADLLKIQALFVDYIINDRRGATKDGRKIYSLEDVYPHADLVTYPSVFEGFGNAFLEAIYFKKPILVNNYSIYSHDIKPKGFDVIEIDDFISASSVEYARNVLSSPSRIEEMGNKNYDLALHYYSYSILKNKLGFLATSFWGSDNSFAH